MAVALTAAAVLLVIVLYAITAFSKRNFVASAEPTPAPQETASGGAVAGNELVPPEIESEAASIRASADSLTGAARAARLAEAVNLYVGRGLYQHAAEAQADVAEAIGTSQAWADAGNLSYRAMQEAEGQAKITYAAAAIEAYTRSLEIDPDNLDVRTDMATAYLATNNPMEGVRQIRQVLDANPDHVQANFNYGVMLSMIGRTDQSIAQFERVRELVDPGSDTYRQAELALQELRGGSPQ
ncbi:MAG TPA: tetratricopeptide repeat protein [Rhodothermales bacterium]